MGLKTLLSERRNSFDGQRKQILKNNKIDVNKKYDLLLDVYKDFYENKLKAEANLAVNEVYYNEFANIQNSTERSKVYMDIFHDVADNMILVKANSFIKDLAKLQTQGFDVKNVDSYLYENVITLAKRLTTYDGVLSNHKELLYNATQIANSITGNTIQDELIDA